MICEKICFFIITFYHFWVCLCVCSGQLKCQCFIQYKFASHFSLLPLFNINVWIIFPFVIIFGVGCNGGDGVAMVWLCNLKGKNKTEHKKYEKCSQNRLLLSHIYMRTTTWFMNVCTCTRISMEIYLWRFWIGNKHLYQDMMRRVGCPWTVQIGRPKHWHTYTPYTASIIQNHCKTSIVFKTINPVKSVFRASSLWFILSHEWIILYSNSNNSKNRRTRRRNKKFIYNVIYFMHDNTLYLLASAV